ncbi:uncharacterized protein LOC110983737 [Acanthaster planci]|uniref:L-ectoine synthase n=1 Tax=Acanthaster planci TaxID=133434 RepID=A0A8B7Z2G2_ACAPL|nr:uncharacterized protein LOC110983737 [Acanthaster planci]XP_022098950.1 uncharacterized protein LOC110983737 [Acanthaster planci]XP_022098960.1 uncharacterized protein LOC110983737 [Acanthaster planci]
MLRSESLSLNMLITHSVDFPESTLPNSALSGVQLTTEKDFSDFTIYEARVQANSTVPFRSPDNKRSLHFYYCISGRGKFQASAGGEKRDICPDTVIALSSDVIYELTVSAEGPMRVFVVYYPDNELVYTSLAVVRSLAEIDGTERDVDWGNGHSWQYLLKPDGLPLGISKTRLNPVTSSKLAHQHHTESVYYTSGRVTYKWQDTSGTWVNHSSKVDAGNGTNVLLNDHDRHILENHEEYSNCISIFYPALTGKEEQVLTEDGFTGFESSY